MTWSVTAAGQLAIVRATSPGSVWARRRPRVVERLLEEGVGSRQVMIIGPVAGDLEPTKQPPDLLGAGQAVLDLGTHLVQSFEDGLGRVGQEQAGAAECVAGGDPAIRVTGRIGLRRVAEHLDLAEHPCGGGFSCIPPLLPAGIRRRGQRGQEDAERGQERGEAASLALLDGARLGLDAGELRGAEPCFDGAQVSREPGRDNSGGAGPGIAVDSQAVADQVDQAGVGAAGLEGLEGWRELAARGLGADLFR